MWKLYGRHTAPRGLNLAVPVLRDVFPQGLEELDASRAKRLRSAYEEWRDAVDNNDADRDKLHTAWIDEVLRTALEADDQLLKPGRDARRAREPAVRRIDEDELGCDCRIVPRQLDVRQRAPASELAIGASVDGREKGRIYRQQSDPLLPK